MRPYLLLFHLLLVGVSWVKPGVTNPISEICGPSVVCINRYANILPYHFYRNVSTETMPTTFGDTLVANGSTLTDVKSADFVVFDKERGLEILGSEPSYEYMFAVSYAIHEAPVYVESQNKLYLSQLAPPAGYLPQLVVDLNQVPPTLSEFLSDPPVYAPNGGTFHNGKIIWGASGGNQTIEGGEQRVSLRTLDPETNKTTTLVNNYFGYYFNTIDDLAVHPKTGDIWFTDPRMLDPWFPPIAIAHVEAQWADAGADYSWFNGLTDTPPQLPAASYRYNMSSGAVTVVDDSLGQPNGVAFNPEGTIVYISDSVGASGPVDPKYGHGGTPFNTTHHRTIYAFDVSEDGTQAFNKRPIYLAAGFIPDGLKVAANGCILSAVGRGIDVLDPLGQLLLTIQTNYTVQNFAWTGPELKTLWLMGSGGISKVEWELAGQRLK